VEDTRWWSITEGEGYKKLEDTSRCKIPKVEDTRRWRLPISGENHESLSLRLEPWRLALEPQRVNQELGKQAHKKLMLA